MTLIAIPASGSKVGNETSYKTMTSARPFWRTANRNKGEFWVFGLE